MQRLSACGLYDILKTCFGKEFVMRDHIGGDEEKPVTNVTAGGDEEQKPA
jgi:hypothetical protein